MKILVTGAAGFIGFHTSRKLLETGHEVVGLDNLNAYYDPSLKHARLEILKKYKKFTFCRLDLTAKNKMQQLFKKHSFSVVVHLAAQAGVRYSLENPDVYIESNIRGFLNILESCRHNRVKHLIYASSSSVYGLNKKFPFKVGDYTDQPTALYGATKKANELMAHVYHHLFALPVSGLRFFTVYGPWGRPDLAMFIFTKNILKGKPIDVFNYGRSDRDFTYIDDIVDGITRVIKKGPKGYRLYNLGNSHPENIMSCVRLIEKYTGKKATIRFKKMHRADISKTFADIKLTQKELGYSPKTRIEEGLKEFINWYVSHYDAKV